MSTEGYAEIYTKARTALRSGQLLQAIDLFEEAIEQNPDEADAHDGLATACYLAKDFPGAIRHFTRVTQLKPREARAYVNLGALYNVQEEYAKAADSLRKGIQRDGRNAEAYYNLGIAQKHLNQNAMAVSAYREALRLNPALYDAHLNLANMYFEQGLHRKSIDEYTAALGVEPDSAKARRGIEYVQRVMNENKATENPFGRLVDTSKLLEKGAKSEASINLNEEQRFADRQFLQVSASESGDLGGHLWIHLKDHVDPALLEVIHFLARDADGDGHLYKAHSKLHESVKFANKLFENWLAVHERMKAHESEMKA